jgi:hypothetical protein
MKDRLSIARGSPWRNTETALLICPAEKMTATCSNAGAATFLWFELMERNRESAGCSRELRNCEQISLM